MNQRERETIETLKEKGISFEHIKGMTCGEVKRLTEDYKRQLRRLNK